MKTIESPVSQGLILICEKCGKELASKSDENPSKVLQHKIREKTRKQFGKKEIRAVMTSCMDVCPKGKIAVAVIANDGAPRFFEADAKKLDEQSDKIIEELRIKDK